MVAAQADRRVLAVILAVATAAASSYGCTGEHPGIEIGVVPLAPHVRVSSNAYGCPVAPDVCYRWAIFEMGSQTSAAELKQREKRALLARGWNVRRGSSRASVASDSPDGKWFVSLETGPEQLAEIRRGRSSWGDRQIVRRLRALIAKNRATLAVTLERRPHR
jgi:hypothetical protein